jgi:hypothetical protein
MDVFAPYPFVPAEHRTSKDGFVALSPFINRHNAVFDVGRSMLDVQIFLNAIALLAPIVQPPDTGEFLTAAWLGYPTEF